MSFPVNPNVSSPITQSFQNPSKVGNDNLKTELPVLPTDKEVKNQLENASRHKSNSLNFNVFKKLLNEKGVRYTISFCIGHKLMSIGQKLEGKNAGVMINKFFKQINKRASDKNAKNLGEIAQVSSSIEQKYQSIKKKLNAALEKKYPEVDKELLLKEFKKYAIFERGSDLSKTGDDSLVDSLLKGFEKTGSSLVEYSKLTKELKNYKPDPQQEKLHQGKLKELASKGMISALKKQIENGGIEISSFLLEKSLKKYIYDNPKKETSNLISDFCKDKKEELLLLSTFHEPHEMKKTGERMLLEAEQHFKESKPQSSRPSMKTDISEPPKNSEEQIKERELRIQASRRDQQKQEKPKVGENKPAKRIVIDDSELGIEE